MFCMESHPGIGRRGMRTTSIFPSPRSRRDCPARCGPRVTIPEGRAGKTPTRTKKTAGRNPISRIREILGVSALVFVAGAAGAQAAPPEWHSRNWDFGIFAAGATGEENTHSFAEAQIVSGGFFLGRALTDQIGQGWRRGRLQFGADFITLYVQAAPERRYGIGFDPIILRWNWSVERLGVSPFLELGGGGVHTNENLPAGDTSNFNFRAHAGGGVRIARGEAQVFEIGCRWWHISNANLATAIPSSMGFS